MSDETKKKIEVLLEKRYPGATATVKVSTSPDVGYFAWAIVRFPGGRAGDALRADGAWCDTETLALQSLALFVTPEILA